MWRSNQQLLLSFLTFLSGVMPDGTLEEHPEKYGYDVFYRNAYNPYQFIDNTNFTTLKEYEDADPCWADKCNRGGFCYRLENNTYSCDCLSTREGKTCEYAYVDLTGGLQSSNYTEVPEIDPRCDGIDCNGNGECVLINIGTLGLSEYEASCGCSMGYSEADDCLTWVGCEDVVCSNNGVCVDGEVDGVKKVGCICETGWTGTTCAISQRECTEGVLVNMVNQLAEFDKSAALACADIWPFVPYVYNPTTICDCLNAVAENIPQFLEENKCILDNRYYHGYQTLSDIQGQYCTECSTQEIENSLQIIISESAVCEYYDNYQQEMPLYMKSYWRCECYATLGMTSDQVSPYLKCPMEKSSFISTEMISWTNCEAITDDENETPDLLLEEFAQGKRVCLYQDVYGHLKTELFDYSKRASDTCSKAWQKLAMETDVEANFKTHASLFCDCFDLLNAYYPAGLKWFDCHVLTTHQAAFGDLITHSCYTPEVIDSSCVSEIMRYGTLLAANNDVRGSLTTFQAMRSGAVSNTLTNALNDMMCYSYNAGVSLGLTESEMFDFHECEDVAGYSWEYTVNCIADINEEVMDNKEEVTEVDDLTTIMEASMFTTGGGGNYWQTQLMWASMGTILGCAIFGVAGYQYGKVSKPTRGLVFTSKIPYAEVGEH